MKMMIGLLVHALPVDLPTCRTPTTVKEVCQIPSLRPPPGEPLLWREGLRSTATGCAADPNGYILGAGGFWFCFLLLGTDHLWSHGSFLKRGANALVFVGSMPWLVLKGLPSSV